MHARTYARMYTHTITHYSQTCIYVFKDAIIYAKYAYDLSIIRKKMIGKTSHKIENLKRIILWFMIFTHIWWIYKWRSDACGTHIQCEYFSDYE